METLKKVIPINHILAHIKKHWDEFVAIFILRLFGEKWFQGIGNAKIRHTNGVEPKPDAFFDALKMLPVGCALTRFDEHRADVERLAGECATTLVCKYLGLMEEKAIRRIAEETLFCDSKKGVAATEIPSIVKTAHRRLEGDSDDKVEKWCKPAFNAIYATLNLNFARDPEEVTLKEHFLALDKEGRFPEKRARDSVASIVGRSQSVFEKWADKPILEQPCFELAFIVSALYRTSSVPKDEVLDWVMFPLDHIYAEQLEFWKAVDDARTPRIGRAAIRIKGAKGGKEKEGIKVLLIHTDNLLTAKASRMDEVGADVTVVRNSKGNIHVSVDADTDINLGTAIRMLRWYCLPKDTDGQPIIPKDEHGKPQPELVSWASLGKEGHHPLVPNLYFFENSILNGSETHPAEPLDICSAALEDLFSCAFDGQAVIWMRERDIFKKKPVQTVGDALEAAKKMPPAQDEIPSAGEDKKAA